MFCVLTCDDFRSSHIFSAFNNRHFEILNNFVNNEDYVNLKIRAHSLQKNKKIENIFVLSKMLIDKKQLMLSKLQNYNKDVFFLF